MPNQPSTTLSRPLWGFSIQNQIVAVATVEATTGM
jgi:hypothetical protein